MIQSEVEMMRRHPLIGAGLDSLVWLEPLKEYRDHHNTYFAILAQTGIIGFVAFVWFIAWFVKDVCAQLQQNNSLDKVKLALCAACLAVGIHGLFSANDDFRHLWILLGLCLAVS